MWFAFIATFVICIEACVYVCVFPWNAFSATIETSFRFKQFVCLSEEDSCLLLWELLLAGLLYGISAASERNTSIETPLGAHIQVGPASTEALRFYRSGSVLATCPPKRNK